MRLLDLFSGIAGFSLAARWLDWQTVAFAEIDPFCRSVIRKHWPRTPIFEDIRDVSATSLRAAGIDHVDIACGGFPCQDISLAGKGDGIHASRSGLWWEMRRVVSDVRPRWLVVENVPGLRTRGGDAVLASLEELGYACWPLVVGAWTVGAPHRRDRVWIVAHRQSERLAQRSRQRGDAREEFETLERNGSCEPGQSHRWPARPGEPQHEWEAPRLVESGLCRATDGLPGRLAPSRRRAELKALGNAVVPQVAYEVLRAVGEVDALLSNRLRVHERATASACSTRGGRFAHFSRCATGSPSQRAAAVGSSQPARRRTAAFERAGRSVAGVTK